MYTKILLGTTERMDHFSDLCIDRRIILKWAVRKYCLMKWTGINSFRIEHNGVTACKRK